MAVDVLAPLRRSCSVSGTITVFVDGVHVETEDMSRHRRVRGDRHLMDSVGGHGKTFDRVGQISEKRRCKQPSLGFVS